MHIKESATPSLQVRRLKKALMLTVLVATFIALAPSEARPQVWTVLTFDTRYDAKDPSLADAALLAYRYDKQEDRLWFRVSVYGKPNEQAFGVNIAFDTGGDEAKKINWWGGNTAFKFDKLLVAWVTRAANGYEGMIGVGDANGVSTRQINNLRQNNLQISVEGDSILIGVKRTDVTDKMKMNLIAAVGSNQRWNDDVPNTGSVTIDLAAERPTKGLREISSSRNNFALPPDYKILADDRPPSITKHGKGRQPLILIPGMYSGAKSFAGFISRNQEQYKFYVLTPPGINGTPARSMPAAGDSFGKLSWTHRFERDILDLINKEKLNKPVIVAESQPASIAAADLAIEHPDQIGGIVLAGTHLVQLMPSPKDPTRKTPATPEERVILVDEGWGALWFKYVTPETWLSNDMRPEMLSSDPSIGQQAWQEIESAPLEIKIRYLCEFWASDVTRKLDKLQVPVLALTPGFDEKFLADPANSFTKMVYVDSWATAVPKHPQLELVRIPNSRLLMFEDPSRAADDAVAKFVEKVSKTKKQN